jgi:hypothetical protein
MPRVNLGIPPRQLQYEEQLREDYGKTMTINDICDFFHFGERRTAIAWLSDVPCILNGRYRFYRVQDVAQKMYATTVTL